MRKVTKEEFKKRIKERFPEEDFEIIQYDSVGKPGIFKCKQCNTNIEVKAAGNFLAPNKRYGCKNCHGFWKQREKKLEALKEKYDILGYFVKDTHKHYTIKCKKCGHERTSTLANLYNHLECGCETGVFRGRTGEEFIKQVNEINSDNYSLVDEYVNQSSPLKIRHSCGLIFSVYPHDAISGKISCPHCHKQESLGERHIANYFLKKNIPFQREAVLKNGSRQRFDFLLEKNNNIIAIEYQGKQHYEESNFFKASLEEIQKNDERKRQYCRENNIILYEIPYTIQFKNLPLVLDGILNRFNDYPQGVDSSESKSCLSVDFTDKDIVSSLGKPRA